MLLSSVCCTLSVRFFIHLPKVLQLPTSFIHIKCIIKGQAACHICCPDVTTLSRVMALVRILSLLTVDPVASGRRVPSPCQG